MDDAIIKIRGLAKTFRVNERRGLWKKVSREVVALHPTDLDIARGEIFGLLGPNGAGKTTLIKCLTTLLLPTSGSAWINGLQLEKRENEIRASIGCMLMGDRGLYWKLTGRENLDFFGALYQLSPEKRQKRTREIIDRLALGDLADRPVETYSSGQKMRLAFAKALVGAEVGRIRLLTLGIAGQDVADRHRVIAPPMPQSGPGEDQHQLALPALRRSAHQHRHSEPG